MICHWQILRMPRWLRNVHLGSCNFPIASGDRRGSEVRIGTGNETTASRWKQKGCAVPKAEVQAAYSGMVTTNFYGKWWQNRWILWCPALRSTNRVDINHIWPIEPLTRRETTLHKRYLGGNVVSVWRQGMFDISLSDSGRWLQHMDGIL